jgi:hypothetical protein
MRKFEVFSVQWTVAKLWMAPTSSPPFPPGESRGEGIVGQTGNTGNRDLRQLPLTLGHRREALVAPGGRRDLESAFCKSSVFSYALAAPR